MDSDSERASSIDDYKITCIQFIEDISSDYKEWVDRYNLSSEENISRKKAIDSVVKDIEEWIGKYGNSIKKIDIIKDAGINKMAEFTAGFPFEFNILVENQSFYVHVPRGSIVVNVKAKPRNGKKARITYWVRHQFVQLLSSCNASVDLNGVNFDPKDELNEYITLDANESKMGDIIALTIAVEEVLENSVGDKRGLTTLFRTK